MGEDGRGRSLLGYAGGQGVRDGKKPLGWKVKYLLWEFPGPGRPEILERFTKIRKGKGSTV